MIKTLLGLFGASSGGWIIYAVIAAVIFGAGSLAGGYTRGVFDAAATAKVQHRYDALWAQTQQAIAAQERDRADANAKAAEETSALSRRIAELQASLSKNAIERGR